MDKETDKSRKDKKKRKKGKRVVRIEFKMIFIACVILVLLTVADSFKSAIPTSGDLSYTEFQEMLEDDKIESVKVVKSESTFTAVDKDGNSYSVVNPDYDEFKKDLLESGVTLEISKSTMSDAITSALLSIPMLVLMFIILYYIVKSMGNQTNTLFKVLKPEEVVTFDDVAGMSETKEEVKFAVSQLKNRKQIKELGARPCHGIILEGPPGTGKTLLAKAIAGEADVPFISTSGADFIEMFVGLGAARVRALWELAQANAPCVIFIDEIDAVGRRRTGGGDGASTESNQTLNALLQRMDGLGGNSGIFVVGATNRVSDLDPALLRPGRFDKHLYVGPPKSKKDRDEIIKVHMKGKKFDETFDFDKASRLMFGLSGAEIEQVINEATLISLQEGREGIASLNDIDAAVMKLRAQGVKVSHTSQKDIDITAVHESGHAVMSCLLGRKVAKVSIMPYSSGIGGMTVQDVDAIEDTKMKTKQEMIDDIKILLAGRAAEKIFFGDTSIGCSNDISRATQVAYSVLNQFAMDEKHLINVEAIIQVAPNIITNGDKTYEEVNNLLVECNKQVLDALEYNKSEIEKLSERLKVDEVILDYELSTTESKQEEASVELEKTESKEESTDTE